VGRFPSVDPHSSNYFSLSPYTYVANTPVIAIDPDGRDYILIVDHKARTITIKAVYYTKSGDATAYSSAQNATTFWNNKSGKYSYQIKNGKTTLSYQINFDLQVHPVASPAGEATKDKSPRFSFTQKLTSDGSSNIYEIKSDANQLSA
jgi:hypothetical protein